eukprot:8358300-Prorocentrum_lima.AAC.1
MLHPSSIRYRTECCRATIYLQQYFDRLLLAAATITFNNIETRQSSQSRLLPLSSTDLDAASKKLAAEAHLVSSSSPVPFGAVGKYSHRIMDFLLRNSHTFAFFCGAIVVVAGIILISPQFFHHRDRRSLSAPSPPAFQQTQALLVGVFWDSENVHVPKGVSAQIVAANII